MLWHTGRPLSLANGQGVFGLTGANAVLEEIVAYTHVMLVQIQPRASAQTDMSKFRFAAAVRSARMKYQKRSVISCLGIFSAHGVLACGLLHCAESSDSAR